MSLLGTIPKVKENQQVLDRLQVERERGITVKAQTASLIYIHKGQTYLLNLIDTPVRHWFFVADIFHIFQYYYVDFDINVLYK